MAIDAEAFAKFWIDSGNARDLDAFMEHHDELIVFRSP